MKRPATSRIWDLRAKLQALVDRGVNGEKDAAQAKLERLEKRYDFSKPDVRGPDLFAGVFRPASDAAPVIGYDLADADIANAVKWGIETLTGIRCVYRSGQLMALAEPTTANRLHEIAATVTANMSQLWQQYRQSPGVNGADRNVFVLGLFEGMLDQTRHNEALPRRPVIEKVNKPKKRNAIAGPVGVSVHPYSVGAQLGKQIRFCVPIEDLAGELDRTIKGELPQEAAA